jgi:hypothetical protein
LLAAVDATITKQFINIGYTPQSCDEYMDLIRTHYHYPTPDMTHSFFGPAGAFATCFVCERESRGLHLHVHVSSPHGKDTAFQVLNKIEANVSKPALRYGMLRRVISELTWGHKLTLVSVILAVLGTMTTLAGSFALTGMLLESVKAGFGIVLVLSLAYIIAVLLFVIARVYYGSRLVSRF